MRAGHTLQTTALVHEVYLKLGKQEKIEYESRSHFFAIAAKLMRQILIDYARTKQRVKRGGIVDNLPLEKRFDGGCRRNEFRFAGTRRSPDSSPYKARTHPRALTLAGVSC